MIAIDKLANSVNSEAMYFDSLNNYKTNITAKYKVKKMSMYDHNLYDRYIMFNEGINLMPDYWISDATYCRYKDNSLLGKVWDQKLSVEDMERLLNDIKAEQWPTK